MRIFSLGIDTSCYTTSLAIVDSDGKIILDERIPLKVKPGQRGLRQAEAFYQHVLNLPELFEKASIYADSIRLVSVSEKPRNAEKSYMPVFNAGTAFARAVAGMLSLPIFFCSHQEGHILSVLDESGIDSRLPFIAVHLSGGTAEIMKLVPEGKRLTASIIGGSLDITAGQLIDRLGVRLGYGFPAGKTLDEIACDNDCDEAYPVSVKNGYFNFSGIENMSENDLKKGLSPEKIIVKSFNCIANTLVKAFAELGISDETILMTGGVSASLFIKKKMVKRLKAISYGYPSLCTDNAVGIARMGISLLGAEEK